ncbi:hypothetical protein CVT26_001876 [Gymnopilus dilepis]|uniref:Ubiquitin 3 binding protein But2 C-terminal domain-containing protein n=1 Tax=Gymnopilus dilepis TaxID=231916 RepID=A0A409Y3X4_9AGAR|nr:hypothetical protein CVT26_001876 [Gymnopilus dilepis]
MKLIDFALGLSVVASLATHVSSVTPPGASTPLFYLVATSSSSTTNLAVRPVAASDVNSFSDSAKPLRLDGTLTGSSPVVEFYLNSQGQLALIDPTTSTNYNALIDSAFNGDCSADGAIVFLQGSSSNKCAKRQGFQIQSDTENSQLGAQLVFNFVGGFYACGSNQAIWYKVNAADAPSDCSPVSLYTVPVVA